MAVPPLTPQLSSRDDDGKQGSSWEPMQIAAPAIVGGTLLLAIAAYVVWKQRRSRTRPYDYHQVRTDWVSKMSHMFNSRPTRRRVVPTTLPNSIRTPHSRLASTDSQTPLTTDYQSDFPPLPKLPDSPPAMAKRPAVRWWWLFGSRPQEIKSEEPSSRWHVDGPDGSSTGHGHTDHEESRARYAVYLETTHEVPAEDGGIGATPRRPVPEMSSLPDRSGSFVARPPVPTVAASPRRNESATQVSSGDRGLLPSYGVSHTHTPSLVPSAGETARLPHSESYTVFPPAFRTAGHSSPRVFNGHEPSSESFLRAQSLMVATY